MKRDQIIFQELSVDRGVTESTENEAKSILKYLEIALLPFFDPFFFTFFDPFFTVVLRKPIC